MFWWSLWILQLHFTKMQISKRCCAMGGIPVLMSPLIQSLHQSIVSISQIYLENRNLPEVSLVSAEAEIQVISSQMTILGSPVLLLRIHLAALSSFPRIMTGISMSCWAELTSTENWSLGSEPAPKFHPKHSQFISFPVKFHSQFISASLTVLLPTWHLYLPNKSWTR